MLPVVGSGRQGQLLANKQAISLAVALSAKGSEQASLLQRTFASGRTASPQPLLTASPRPLGLSIPSFDAPLCAHTRHLSTPPCLRVASTVKLRADVSYGRRSEMSEFRLGRSRRLSVVESCCRCCLRFESSYEPNDRISSSAKCRPTSVSRQQGPPRKPTTTRSAVPNSSLREVQPTGGVLIEDGR
jgi:hypothetical protein